jgi:enoyl-CoA hydratase
MTVEPQTLRIDAPAERVRRITLNRPEKRNAINNAMRRELFDTLQVFDDDPEVGCTILRGAGKCFSSGYDLSADLTADRPYYTAGGDGGWSRHVIEGWTGIWDLAKPVIAQVHGYAMDGGSELMTACDLAYVAEDAQIGYPMTRLISPPDAQFHTWLVGMRQAMEMILTGDSVSGLEAARIGLVNRAYPKGELEERTLGWARRIAEVPSDLQQINKRSVHRAMELMGVRTGMRQGSEIAALALHQKSVKARMQDLANSAREAFAKGDRGD